MADHFIIQKPWITEKSTTANASGKYAFLVKEGASKPEVKKAIHAHYKVDVVSVNMINRPPKNTRFGAKKGVHGGYRKAIVTLKVGQKIDFN